MSRKKFESLFQPAPCRPAYADDIEVTVLETNARPAHGTRSDTIQETVDYAIGRGFQTCGGGRRVIRKRISE